VTTRRPTSATPFSFGEDLRPSAAARRAADDLARIAEEQQREAAARDAFEEGRRAGRAEAEAEIARLRLHALERIAMEAGQALEGLDARAAVAEDEALAFFETLARTLAGRALAEQPLAAIREAAREAFRHLRGVPHLVARVHESLVEDVDVALRTMSREHGFEGRIVVIGSDEIAPGDARLDWADGAVVTERGAVEAAVADVLARSGYSGTLGGSS
jgi:flagellar assembly protein FliH